MREANFSAAASAVAAYSTGLSGARRLFLVAGEQSGDELGGKLMAAVNVRLGNRVQYSGVGGLLMEREGLASIFPLSDVAVMGPLAIAAKLPRLVARVYQTVSAAIEFNPDVVVIIDAPEFTHAIAKRIRKRRPDIPIIDYVSPSVWAWRPGRARRMRRWVDHVMALLPFEPDVHARLNGPRCTYVGHPLIERYSEIRNADPVALATELGIVRDRPVLVVLPGSRRSEVERLMQPFGRTLQLLSETGHHPDVLIPAVEHVRALIQTQAASWSITPHILSGEVAKFRAFRLADAALVASGTATLELALAATPMVVAYRVDAVAAQLQYLVNTPHYALSNLVLGERAFPEFMQDNCTPENLAKALGEVLVPGAIRERQRQALERVPGLLRLASGTPSEAAAKIVLTAAHRSLLP